MCYLAWLYSRQDANYQVGRRQTFHLSAMYSMKKIAAVLLVLSLLALGLTLEIPQVVKVFYVKPTVAPTTECPSGDSPCHSLQYYAN